jgi:hypothetical protein
MNGQCFQSMAEKGGRSEGTGPASMPERRGVGKTMVIHCARDKVAVEGRQKPAKIEMI